LTLELLDLFSGGLGLGLRGKGSIESPRLPRAQSDEEALVARDLSVVLHQTKGGVP